MRIDTNYTMFTIYPLLLLASGVLNDYLAGLHTFLAILGY